MTVAQKPNASRIGKPAEHRGGGVAAARSHVPRGAGEDQRREDDAGDERQPPERRQVRDGAEGAVVLGRLVLEGGADAHGGITGICWRTATAAARCAGQPRRLKVPRVARSGEGS
jgi:hypothetical protein